MAADVVVEEFRHTKMPAGWPVWGRNFLEIVYKRRGGNLMKRILLSSTAFLVILLGTSFALAVPSWKDRKDAQKLAADAKKLAKKGKYKKAAKKYKKAAEKNPAPSYRLELAKMLVELGDFVQAGEVLGECTESKPKQWTERKAWKGCQTFATEVEERTPSLEVSVFEPSSEEVTVTVNGEEFDPAEGAVAFNPGKYTINAEAEGYDDFSQKVKLAEGDVEAVEISMAGGAAEDADEEDDDDDSDGLSPWPAYIAWGAGAVGLGLGIGFGIAAITTTNDVLRLYDCAEGVCPPDAEDDLNTAKTNGNISTAGFIIGGVGAVAGTILYLLADTDDDDGDDGDEGDEEDEGLLRLEAKPVVGPGFVGMTGTF